MATYYVSTSGNDSWDGTAPAYVSGTTGPWATSAHAVSTISSGDRVELRGGNYSEGLYVNGKSYASTTTFAVYANETPILDGTGIEHEAYEDGVILIHNSNHVTVDGLKVIDGYKAGITVVGGQNVQISNCTSENTYLSGIALWGVENSTVENNTIANSNIPNGHDEILSIAGGCANIEVRYNTLYAGDRTFSATGGEGLNIKDGCSYIYVHHNTINMARPDAQESDRYSMGVDGWTNETHHIYFYKNIIKNGSWGLQYNSEEGGATHHIYGWNNIIIHCGHSGYMHGGGIGCPPYGVSPGTLSYCYWWNNTIYDCYYGAKFDKEELSSEIIVRNNIIYDSGQADTYFGASNENDVTLDHNLLSTDPKFISANNENFRLQSDSPARDTGTTIAYPIGNNEDYDGMVRPQGANYDIGAFEYEEQAKILMRHHRLA